MIAIIAILAAILFPVFAKAREKARQASCTSNIKQIMLSWHMYTQDYDERVVPYSDTGVSSPANAMPWNLLVQPYQKNTNVTTCPDCPFANAYTYNANISRTDSFNASPPRKLGAIVLPSQTPVFIDAVGLDGPVPAANTTPFLPYPYNQCGNFFIDNPGVSAGGRILVDPTNFSKGWVASGTGANIAQEIHSDGATYGLADGHVKWYHYATDPKLPTRHVPARNNLNYRGDGNVGGAGGPVGDIIN